MAALQAEDTVKEITSTITNVYNALVKEFNLGEQAQKDKDSIQMVRYFMKYWNTGRYTYGRFTTTVTHHVV